MRLSGVTVAWRGTPSLDDWVAYIVNGTKSKKLILADHASERKVKMLARAHAALMTKKEVRSSPRASGFALAPPPRGSRRHALTS